MKKRRWLFRLVVLLLPFLAFEAAAQNMESIKIRRAITLRARHSRENVVRWNLPVVGYSGPEHPRVVVLGGSTSTGYPYQDYYPGWPELLPKELGPVANLAGLGHTSLKNLMRYAAVAPASSYVVIYQGFNDAIFGCASIMPASDYSFPQAPASGPLTDLLPDSFLASGLVVELCRACEPPGVVPTTAFHRELIPIYRRNLDEIEALAKLRKATVIIGTHANPPLAKAMSPAMWDGLRQINAATRAWAHEHGARLVECEDIIPADEFIDPIHTSWRGNEILAHAFAEALEDPAVCSSKTAKD